MRIEFDARLLEEAVFAAVRRAEARGDARQPAAYRRRLDTCYELPAGSRERERAFRVIHAAWFEALGLQGRVTDAVAEVPALSAHCERLLIDKALTSRHEGGELFVRGGEAVVRTAVIRLRAETLVDETIVLPMLRRELRHLADMVAPDFGYRPTVGDLGDSPARENLLRDRYRVCWDASVDGRLVREGRLSGATADDHWPAFARAFASLPPESARTLCDRAWQAGRPTHAEFAAWATAGAPTLATAG